jgi:hypothetical protein
VQHSFLLPEIILLILNQFLQMFQLALIKLAFLLSLLLLYAHLCLMPFIHRPQLSILFFMKIHLITLLDHRFHQSHTESGVLIPHALYVKLKFVLDTLQLNL